MVIRSGFAERNYGRVYIFGIQFYVLWYTILCVLAVSGTSFGLGSIAPICASPCRSGQAELEFVALAAFEKVGILDQVVDGKAETLKQRDRGRIPRVNEGIRSLDAAHREQQIKGDPHRLRGETLPPMSGEDVVRNQCVRAS